MVSKHLSFLLRHFFLDYDKHEVDTPILQKTQLLESYLIQQSKKEREMMKVNSKKKINKI